MRSGQAPRTLHIGTHAAQAGFALGVIVLSLLIGLGALLVTGLNAADARIDRDKSTAEALARAKAALIEYAITHDPTNLLTPTSSHGPGYLPCPDLDDKGSAGTSCGSFSGATGQEKRLGRLPWKTLGIPDLRDSSGERLWYAVSSVYKNNSPKPGLNPDTGMGTITVRDPSGSVIHDGTSTDLYRALAGGAVAVIIAPGPAIDRIEVEDDSVRTAQNRTCNGGWCDADGVCLTNPARTTPKCNPVNYLERAAGGVYGNEDNADFADRNDVRSGNTNGFIQGPVIRSDGTLLVNDRIVVITYLDIMQAMMKRVAVEAYHCLDEYRGSAPNLGRYPYPAPVCRSGYSNSNQWSDQSAMLFGRFPQPPFNATRHDGGSMSDHWTAGSASQCSIWNSATSSPSPWWQDWQFHVFYAIASNLKPAPSAPPACTASACLQIGDPSGSIVSQNKQFAVIVAGPPLNNISPVQSHGGSESRFPQNYLEGTNPGLEAMNDISGLAECSSLAIPAEHPAVCSPLSACNQIRAGTRDSMFNDVVLYFPP
jgi:type II secretory pathway pseudopilin PulG